MKKFSGSEAISFGWKTFKAHPGFFILVLIIAWLIDFAPSFLSSSNSQDTNSVIGFMVALVFWVLNIVVSIGLVKVALEFCEGKRVAVSDLFSSYQLFWKYLVASILYGLMVFVGFLLLVIPGIFLSVKFGYYSYLIIDKKMGPIEALKKSSQITQGAKWDLFLFNILLVLINILGLIALVVGLFVTVPITMVASAYVYKRLSSQTS